MKHAVILGEPLAVVSRGLTIQGLIDLCELLDIPMGETIRVCASGDVCYDATRMEGGSWSSQIVSMVRLVRRNGEQPLTVGALIGAWPFDREARLVGPNTRELIYHKHSKFDGLQLMETL